MKKKLLLTAALVLSLGAASITANPVSAEETTAEFTVEPGALTLDEVPDLNFGTVPIKNLIEGDATAELVGYENVLPGDDGNQTGDVQVSDYRGSNAGWSLYAQMTPFALSTDANVTLDGTMTLTGAETTSTGVAPGAFGGDIATDSQNVLVWNAAVNTGTGQNNDVTEAGEDNYLTLDRNTGAVPGRYDSDVTWTLALTPDA
ncbi:WxL domain-containing protein [Lacticaseibacillus yichunensis]|uniref:WxL domain-containing protein n=1 Tax=Lacticaseibacillus yichunensis TaxID=2486015 RepID=A0ABW4CU28_9LACO|nr:WxL domain-containing protein [Lacticaseibacillus yichunensis]